MVIVNPLTPRSGMLWLESNERIQVCRQTYARDPTLCTPATSTPAPNYDVPQLRQTCLFPLPCPAESAVRPIASFPVGLRSEGFCAPKAVASGEARRLRCAPRRLHPCPLQPVSRLWRGCGPHAAQRPRSHRPEHERNEPHASERQYEHVRSGLQLPGGWLRLCPATHSDQRECCRQGDP